MRAIVVWTPLPAIFLTYHLAGAAGRWMARPPADELLLGWDVALFGVNPGVWMAERLPFALLVFLDLFYFSYYVLMIASPGLMYLRHGRAALWRFWTTAGISFLICYLLFPWFPSTPPRLVFPEFQYGGFAQASNLWVLNHFSVGANVFPSAHVAAGFSFASCHTRFSRRAGVVFFVWGAGIAVSTVSGGYHYAIDAVAGAAVGVAADLFAERIFRAATLG